jgi:hypothetical protein
MPSRLIAALLASLTAAALAPATAAATLRAFRSPTGNIGCIYFRDPDTPASVRCDTRGGGDHAVIVRKSGKGRVIRVTDTVMDADAPILHYGRKRSFGGITCTSRRTGMTCKNSAGHGFEVSREHRKVF